MNISTMLIGIADYRKRLYNVASFIFLLIYLSFGKNSYIKPFAQCVYNRRTYAVKTAGNLISASAEFSSGMKNSEHDLNSRYSLLRMNSYRNSSSVVLYRNRIVVVNSNIYFTAESAKCLINRIINDFINQMMKSFR